MRDAIYRWTPIVLGLIIGWMMFRPPAWLSALGPGAWVVNVALCGLVLYLFVFWMVLAGLPRELEVVPLPTGSRPWDGGVERERIEALGFVPVGPVMQVSMAPSAQMYAFVHSRHPVYATLFRTGTAEGRVSYDFVSLLQGGRGTLTSGPLPEGATIPAGPGNFRQIFEGAPPKDLFRRHLEALEHLRGRDVPARALSADTFVQDFSRAMAAQREIVMLAPLTSTWLTLWRAATKKVPFRGPIADQGVFARQIVRFHAGTLSGIF